MGKAAEIRFAVNGRREIRSNKQQIASFNDFAQFVSQQADLATDPVYSGEGMSRLMDMVGKHHKQIERKNEMISDGNSSLRSGDFVRVGDERTSPTSYARTFECAGLVIRVQCTLN